MPPTPPVPPSAPTCSSSQECQQLIVQMLKSGQYAFRSADKEGMRTVCYHQNAFLRVYVDDEGTGVLRLRSEEALLGYLWRKSGADIVLENGSYHWHYPETEAEQLKKWQELQARLVPFTESARRQVECMLNQIFPAAAPE